MFTVNDVQMIVALAIHADDPADVHVDDLIGRLEGEGYGLSHDTVITADDGWQIALSRAVEELQRLEPLALTRRERDLADRYLNQGFDALHRIAGRCPDCQSPVGARHYCRRPGVRSYDEIGIPEGDPRRSAANV